MSGKGNAPGYEYKTTVELCWCGDMRGGRVPGVGCQHWSPDPLDLLKKYIRYVEQCEGTHFLYHYAGYGDDQKFTGDEWAALQRLVAEIDAEAGHDE